MTIKFGDPPFDRNFLALAICYGFDRRTRDFAVTGRRWAEARWDEPSQKYVFWKGDGRTTTTEPLEMTAWAELPGNG